VFDPLLHQAVRSKLIATLIHNQKLPFKVLKKELDVTDGNLSSHLKKLEEEKYVQIEKFFENNRPKTVVQITPQGQEAFKKYIKQLKEFIQEN
jgi:DNA-binding MarR family transcriptional regulator